LGIAKGWDWKAADIPKDQGELTRPGKGGNRYLAKAIGTPIWDSGETAERGRGNTGKSGEAKGHDGRRRKNWVKRAESRALKATIKGNSKPKELETSENDGSQGLLRIDNERPTESKREKDRSNLCLGREKGGVERSWFLMGFVTSGNAMRDSIRGGEGIGWRS